MHITEKISAQMNQTFNSTNCSGIRRVSFYTDAVSNTHTFDITFIYNSANVQNLLTLRFLGVTELSFEFVNSDFFYLGELLFNDKENGTSICVGDEIGDFSLICKDVEFIKSEPMCWR